VTLSDQVEAYVSVDALIARDASSCWWEVNN